MCVEVVVHEGLSNKHLDSRESWITLEEVVDGDAKIEVMVMSMGKKSGSSGSGKRVHSQIIDEDLACLDWKKKRKNWRAVTCAVDDEMGRVTGESVDDAMNGDVVLTRFSGMIEWLTEAAKDPCDEKLGSSPEWSKWNYCGSQDTWKQVSLADSKWQENEWHVFLVVE